METVRVATADTLRYRRGLATDGLLKGEASKEKGVEKRWEEVEETVVRLTASTEEVYTRYDRYKGKISFPTPIPTLSGLLLNTHLVPHQHTTIYAIHTLFECTVLVGHHLTLLGWSCHKYKHISVFQHQQCHVSQPEDAWGQNTHYNNVKIFVLYCSLCVFTKLRAHVLVWQSPFPWDVIPDFYLKAVFTVL